nr:hypothetical protein [Helicobacter pylori]
MGFQNENKLEVGAKVKATINDKVVEAKVIGIGFNRVTLQSEKGQTATYAFNSDKFLKWFNKVPLTEALKTNAENKQDDADDLLKGIKIVTSGPTLKQRTTTPKEKEDKYKLSFGFKDDGISNFEVIAEAYTLGERKSRLGVLMSPMFYGGNGNQASAIILTALAHANDFNKHSDVEWYNMIKKREESFGAFDSVDYMDRVELTLFCDLIRLYAKGEGAEVMDLSPSGLWANMLPNNKNEALFIAQLLCDGGINKYNLSCAGLTANLLKDIELNLGLSSRDEIDEILEKEGGENSQN